MASSVQIFINGEPREVREQITVAELIVELGLEPRYVAIEVNLQLVPRGLHDQRQLAPGDRLEIVTLVGGG